MLRTTVTEYFCAQGRELSLWIPVLLAAGIGIYFALPVEPGVPVLAAVAVGAGAAAVAGQVSVLGTRLLLLTVALMLAGYALAGARARVVAAPVLAWHYYGPIVGQVVQVDRSASGALRAELEGVSLPGLRGQEGPVRVRLSFHGVVPAGVVVPGTVIAATGHLSPPSEPVEPGGFDFRRVAWFEELGAVGYTRAPPLPAVRQAAVTARHRIARFRVQLSEAIRARIPGEAGAFAAAVMTGDRSAISTEALEDLRRANLAHLLAISGLHMGLLTGFVFGAARLALAFASPWWPVKKIAAFLALVAALAYLTLSGASVATQRAFIMTAVVLGAVLVDRPALTLRAVALAATIILLFRPESLVEAGFQMSFAATTALVVVFDLLRKLGFLAGLKGWAGGMLGFPVVLVITSAVAGAATAPFSAIHFNQVSAYGLAANLLAVPAMSLVVMPMTVVAAAGWIFGLEAVPLQVIGAAVDWVLQVAAHFSALPGAVVTIKAPATVVLPLIASGGVALCLLHDRPRVLALVPMALGLWAWVATPRPDVLISADGALFGVLGPDGRSVNKAVGHGFSAESWLENDGGGLDQETAATLPMPDPAGWAVVRLGTEDAVAAKDVCRWGAVIIAPKLERVGGDCLVISREVLASQGAIALYLGERPIRIDGVRPHAEGRIWSQALSTRE